MKFTSPATGRRRRALVLAAAVPAAALAALTGCSSSSSTSAPAASTAASAPASGGAAAGQPTGSPLTVADVAPFSGPDAALGPTYLASCYGATAAINAAGGVLGHPLTCKSVDTRGDPADAVPAVNQMFASTSSLALVIGCTSDEAASVVPIINAHKMAMFCMTGQSEFDSVHFPYFYRLVPPDLEESYAMVAIAQQLHYTQDRARVRQRHRLADLHPARHRGAEEGRDDAHHRPDARPECHDLPHRGGGDRRSRIRTRS